MNDHIQITIFPEDEKWAVWVREPEGEVKLYKNSNEELFDTAEEAFIAASHYYGIK